MRKLGVGVIVAALFFYFGRKHSVPSANVTQPPTLRTSNQTPQTQKSTEDQPATAQTQDQPTITESIATAVDSELFGQLYSRDFEINWKSLLPTIQKRIMSPLPTEKEDRDGYDKEVVARMGILKALGDTHSDNDPQLKQLLLAYLKISTTQPWPLQREAMHTLAQTSDLDENEQLESLKYLDARTRNTSAQTDREILDRSTRSGE